MYQASYTPSLSLSCSLSHLILKTTHYTDEEIEVQRGQFVQSLTDNTFEYRSFYSMTSDLTTTL